MWLLGCCVWVIKWGEHVLLLYDISEEVAESWLDCGPSGF